MEAAQKTITTTYLTEQLLRSYASAGGINHVDGHNLPSKRAVADITLDLLRLLFPGFFDENPIHSAEIKYETTRLLDSVLARLENEIAKSLENAPPDEHKSGDRPALARDLTLRFLSSLPRLRELLKTDTEAAYDGDPAALSKEEVIVAYPFIEARRAATGARAIQRQHPACTSHDDGVGPLSNGFGSARRSGNWHPLFRRSWHRHGGW